MDKLNAWLPVLVFAGLATLAPRAGAQEAAADATIELVETVPAETPLDMPTVREAHVVWAEMIARAKQSLEIESFYFRKRPDAPGRLAPILDGVEAAAKRGVRVRALSSYGFYDTYPKTVDWLGTLPGGASRTLDVKKLWGGVLHAKCFVVDGQEFFVGSQNWDWRALEHIHELGVHIRHKDLATSLQGILHMDWDLAEGKRSRRAKPTSPPKDTLAALLESQGTALKTPSGKAVKVLLAASPPQALPRGVLWDEPLLVKLLDEAQTSIRLQLLSYKTEERDGSRYGVLEDALARAGKRGVKVQVIVSNWCKRPRDVPQLLKLTALEGVEVRFTNIPMASTGFIPYARVEHAKYLVTDGKTGWIGTSNWSKSYFHTSRNVSLFVQGEAIGADLTKFFDGSWGGPYAEVVKPGVDYEPPRIDK